MRSAGCVSEIPASLERERKHTEEFKREAVRPLRKRGERALADVAARLGVAENLLHAWIGCTAAPLSRSARSARASRPKHVQASGQ